ncbi:GNAT family N-acetyltransferase [Rossellomorea marisflavi]|uniref:GNAT family N-acetyltransferase n=1 Tax=Rossellomorea marisflavi TaxID=189381 RepID=UPI00069DE51F|nr:GNAT family protein [Rossellomorea marisflavi]
MIIRQATESDAEAIIAIRRNTISEQEYFLTTDEEFSLDHAGQVKEMADRAEAGGMTFVAEAEGKVVAFLFFNRSRMKRMRHNGSFGIGILPDYRDRGLGSRMLQHLISWARDQEEIEKICLGVFATNERAIPSYKKAGFVEEGREIRQYKFDDGRYVDNVLMGIQL